MLLLLLLGFFKKDAFHSVLGGPECGHHAQASAIAEHFGYTYISLGDLLRAEVSSGSERGRMIAEIMEKSELVTHVSQILIFGDSSSVL